MLLTHLPLALQVSYRTGRDDLVGDFYVPCLRHAVLYRRAVGYFTSSGLACAAQGLADLVARGGRMRLVASPYLEAADLEALEQARDDPEPVLARITARTFANIQDLMIEDRLNALAWMVADGALEVRLALRVDNDGRFLRGLYHEKVGVFTDAEGNHVAFAGSMNETAGGLVENFESIKVFWSWDDPHGRVAEEIRNFDELWEDRSEGVRVIDFTQASRALLARFQRSEPPSVSEPAGFYPAPRRNITPGTIPDTLELRPYQKAAIQAWIDAKGQGILAMATGTGKTLTALYLACKVAEKNQPLFLVIACPYINLITQWQRELGTFGISSVGCYGGRRKWQHRLQQAYQRVAAGMTPLAAAVVSNDTFLSSTFQTELQPHTACHLLIADEVHNLGATNLRTALPDAVRLRLGLSATPERHYDDAGTRALLDYFGGVVYEFGLKEAIDGGVLCPYDYHPVLVDFTAVEAEEYRDLSVRIGQLYPRDDSGPLPEGLLALLIKRARLIASAADKLPALSRVLSSLENKATKAIVYCGDGRMADPANEGEERQISAVLKLLGEEHDLRVRRFTYEVSTEDREEILAALRTGELDAVVAIRCLDEGIDLPDVRMGFLVASSANPRQFVQRRGRLLRRAPGKTHAVIYDFLVRPPDFGMDGGESGFNIERRLFARELSRVLEFCETARNGPAALASLRDLRIQYNLVSQ